MERRRGVQQGHHIFGERLEKKKGVTDSPWTEQEEGVEEDITEACRDSMNASCR